MHTITFLVGALFMLNLWNRSLMVVWTSLCKSVLNLSDYKSSSHDPGNSCSSFHVPLCLLEASPTRSFFHLFINFWGTSSSRQCHSCAIFSAVDDDNVPQCSMVHLMEFVCALLLLSLSSEWYLTTQRSVWGFGWWLDHSFCFRTQVRKCDR